MPETPSRTATCADCLRIVLCSVVLRSLLEAEGSGGLDC